MSRAVVLIVLAQLTACTCSEPVMIEAQTVDLWGDPIEGVEVTVEGSDAALRSDATGTFVLPMSPRLTVTMAKDGFVTRTAPIEPLDPTKTWKEPFELVTVPPSEGWFAIGLTGYDKLSPVPVTVVEHEGARHVGPTTTGAVETEGDPLRLVLHTTIPPEEVAGFGFQLHALEQTSVATEADAIQVWTSKGALTPVTKSLDATVTAWRVDDVPDGVYAVARGVVIGGDAAAFDALTPDERVVLPFAVD